MPVDCRCRVTQPVSVRQNSSIFLAHQLAREEQHPEAQAGRDNGHDGEHDAMTHDDAGRTQQHTMNTTGTSGSIATLRKDHMYHMLANRVQWSRRD